MKHLFILILLTTCAIGCTDYKSEDQEHSTTLRFPENKIWEDSDENSPSILIDVTIVNNNGIPEIISDKVTAENITIDGRIHRVYYYNEAVDNSSVLTTEISTRVPGHNSGYLFYSNGGGYGCFVFSTWWEGSNGDMLITGACGIGDCVGYPSYCGYYA